MKTVVKVEKVPVVPVEFNYQITLSVTATQALHKTIGRMSRRDHKNHGLSEEDSKRVEAIWYALDDNIF